MKFSFLSSSAATAAALLASANALTTNILLLPLYVYPSPGAWDPVFSTIQSNPSLTFQIIINPDSGPGATTTTPPDSNWATALATLQSYANAQALGYVHTSWGGEAALAVQSNISLWADWGAVPVDGIFVDEVQDSQTAYLSPLVAYARSRLGASSKVVFNAGQGITDTTYFSLADQVVVFENAASSYSASVLGSNVPAKYAAKTSVLVYDFAAVKGGAKSATLKSWIAAMAAAGVGSLDIVDGQWAGANVEEEGTADLANVASLLVAAQH